MSYGAQDAGFIRYQIGNILLAITEAAKLGQFDRYLDLHRSLVTNCFPKLHQSGRYEDCVKVREELVAMFAAEREAYGEASREKEQLRLQPATFEACERMRERLLLIMSEQRLYAFMQAPVRDGRDLALSEDAAVP